MRTFVVTGCNGYIGSHMCHELGALYNDCHIIGIDRVRKNHLKHLYDEFIQVDLALDPIVLSNGKKRHIDAVFHFAAEISVEEGESNPWKYYFNNVTSALRMMKEAKQYGIKNFIFSSTAAVYEKSESSLFGHFFETSSVNPYSVYGKTKAMIENVLIDEKEMNCAILRYFNVAGRNERANLYEEHDPETHLIPLLVRNKDAVIYGTDYFTKDGTCVRDFIDVRDVCRAHTLAYRYMEEKNESLLLNIGSGKGYSVKEVVDKVNEIIHNGKMTVRYEERRPGDVSYLVADTTKIKELLDFQPQYSLEDIIESMK